MTKCTIKDCKCKCHEVQPKCPGCGSRNNYKIGFAKYDKNHKHFKCKTCKRTFYKQVGPTDNKKKQGRPKKKRISESDKFKSYTTNPG